MLLRIALADLKQNRGFTAVAALFILLAALLLASAAQTVATLTSSVRNFIEAAEPPEFIYMHQGTLGATQTEQIDAFAHSHSIVEDHQIVSMLTLPGSSVSWGDAEVSEISSVVDLSLVTQSDHFDFLLGEDNDVAEVAVGEVGVPVFLMEQRNLRIGDRLRLSAPGFTQDFTISSSLRDAQMNASIVSSKRLLVHPDDLQRVAQHLGETEYIVEFKLRPGSDVNTFQFDYEEAGLPRNGPPINKNLILLVNVFDGGIVVLAVLAMSSVPMIVAFVCLRYIVVAGIEDRFDEIGMLKALGLEHRAVRQLYLVRYAILALYAGLLAYPLSFVLTPLLTKAFTPYVGLWRSPALTF